MAWAERLRDLLADRNLLEVAKRVGFSNGRLHAIRSRGQCPNAVDAVKLCRYLGVTVEEVFGDENGAKVARPDKPQVQSQKSPAPRLLAFELARGAWKGRESLKVVGPTRLIESEDWHGQAGFIPILAPIAAGEPREAHDKGFPAGDADAYVEFACDDPNAFALSVDGASMEPDFRHGDIVVASPKVGHRNDTFRDGMVAIILFERERTATIKRVRFGTFNRSRTEPMDYKLEPLNPAFPPVRLKTKEIAAIYPVVGLIRREW